MSQRCSSSSTGRPWAWAAGIIRLQLRSRVLCALAAGLLGLGWVGGAGAAVRVVVDPTVVVQGTSRVVIAVRVAGAGTLSELAAILDFRALDPALPKALLPRIAAVRTTNTVWEAAPGGYVSFSAGSPGAADFDFNVALLSAGKSASGDGVMLFVEADVQGCPLGRYELGLASPELGATQLAKGGVPLAADLVPGSLQIVRSEELPVRVQIGLANGAPRISLPTLLGVQYRVEMAPSIPGGDWASLTQIDGTGQVVVADLPLPPDRPVPYAAFFRVVASPFP